MIVKQIGEEFTEQELFGETSRRTNVAEGTITVFHGDEQPEEETPSPDWINFKKAVWNNQSLYFSIAARAVPNIFATILKVISDGEDGKGDEANLQSLLSARLANGQMMIGFEWSEVEKGLINGYLQANNFAVRI